PDGVEADRSGDDLILRKKEDDTEIRIEGFWEECQPGETQCTAVFNVVGENGQVTEAVLTQDGPVLENFTAGQSGTLAEGINNGIIWGGIAFGAGLAAIALAAGGGGGSSRHKRATEGEQKPVQPEGGQEAGKTDVLSTGSTEAGSGSSSDQVPAVDENGNGKPDAEEAAEAVNAATAKVAEAEAKEKEAEAALTQAKADNKITQQEHDDLAAKNDAVTAAKADAAKAVEGLPAGDAKDGLNGRLAKVDGIDVPAVDENGNGKPDAEEAAEAVNAATAKVAEAEAKEKEAEAALTQAKADNKITQQEHDDLAAKNDAVTAAKADAAKAVEGLPAGDAKDGLNGRLAKVDGIDVPAVDENGNGKPDAEEAAEAFNNAKVHLEKALNTVIQPNDDLYASYKLAFGKPEGNPEESTSTWREVLNRNSGSGFTVDKNHAGEFRYTYNGLEDSDIISTGYSIGGISRTMISRNDMSINTNGGDDIIAVGQDIGRSYSAGYTDKKYVTDMGDGNDILFVGLSNEAVQINLRADGSLRVIDKGNDFSSGDLINVSADYDSDNGGVISSTTINMGSGDDTILALGFSSGGNAIQNSTIALGAGNDIIQVNGGIEASKIDGGTGFDTLIISNGTISSDSFTGFEKIELASSGHLLLHSKDFSNHDIGGILKVTGENGSTVNIQNFNWQESGLGRTEEDGVIYTTYISSDYPDLSLWVQDSIEIL
ncbi:GA-like domain-containing protein, partial [Escherichia coli]|uniref:GA-like domain-containing protein n=1 Tax=Escherichia coli TaxID=562 RepID=UPI00202BAEA7